MARSGIFLSRVGRSAFMDDGNSEMPAHRSSPRFSFAITAGARAFGSRPRCAGSVRLHGAAQRRSVPFDPFLNVVGALTRSEFDDPEISQAVRVKRVFLDDGFDMPSTRARRHDNPAISRDPPTGDQELPGPAAPP